METDFVSSFAKGLRVIEAFGEDNVRLAIADVAKRTGLDRATVRRSLLTLAELGYATYDGKFFSLTPRVLRLGYAYLAATPMPRIIQPYLDQLSLEVGQSASVSVLDGGDIVYVARAAQRRVMSINLMPGSRLPAHCASMGRVLLAALPLTQVEALIEAANRTQFTPRTKTEPGELLDAIRVAREQGYAVIDQELELGLCSLAIPLLSSRGQVVAALNIGVPAAQVAAAELADRYLARMRAVADDLRPLLV